MATVKPLQTPIGDLRWVIISGQGKETLTPGKLKYVATVAYPSNSDKCQVLKETIEDYWEANKPTAIGNKAPKSLGFKEAKDKEGKLTGEIEFTFATDTTYPDGKAKKVTIFDKNGSPVDLGDASVGNGSRGVVHGAMGTYEVKSPKGAIIDAGVTLYLNAVQYTKLVEYTGGVVATAIEDDEDEASSEVNSDEVNV